MPENKDAVSGNKQDLDLEGVEAKDRREFLKKVVKGAATVPALALLLAAGATKASAGGNGCADSCAACGGCTPYGGCRSCIACLDGCVAT